MQSKFSEKLIEKTREYFRKRSGMEISRERAEEWLDSMARLFSWFCSENAAPKVESNQSTK